MRVKDHRGDQALEGCERRRHRADHHTPSSASSCPIVWEQCHGITELLQTACSLVCLGVGRCENEHTSSVPTIFCTDGPEQVRCGPDNSEPIPGGADANDRRAGIGTLERFCVRGPEAENLRGILGGFCPIGEMAGSFDTTLSLDAVRSENATAPAHLQAAHSASFTTDSGGPIPRTALIGRIVMPGGAESVSSTTHPPTRRPCTSMRTCVPIWTRASRSSGTE